jgi:hypothetical protein
MGNAGLVDAVSNLSITDLLLERSFLRFRLDGVRQLAGRGLVLPLA